MTVSPHRQGFTLVQLLVAIAVGAVLLALLVPAIQTVRHSAVRAQCSNNLQNLGLAFQNWKDVNDPKPLPTTSWVSELSRYVENVKTMFNCPLDVTSTVAADSKISVALYYYNYSNPLQIFDQNNTNIVPIVKVPPPAGRCRLSARQPPAGSPEGSWIAEFEVSWNTSNYASGWGYDWNDLYLLIEPQTNGTWKVTDIGADTAGGWIGGYEIGDILDENLNVVAATIKPGDYCFVPGNGRGISYGMNSRAHNLGGDMSNKILLIEYGDTIARVVGPAPYNSDLAIYPTNIRPRHLGNFNVLYADGHVEVHFPDEVDPRDATIASFAWNPDVPR